MSTLLACLAILVAVSSQTVLSGAWPPWTRFFDLPLIPVVYYAVTRGPRRALMAGTVAGLLQDSLEGTLIGVNALSKALLGYLVGVLGLRISLVPLILRITIIAVATVLSRAVEVATLAIMGRWIVHTPWSHLFEPVIGNCLVGGVFLVLLSRDASR